MILFGFNEFGPWYFSATRKDSICSSKYWKIDFSLILTASVCCNGFLFLFFSLKFKFYFLVPSFLLLTCFPPLDLLPLRRRFKQNCLFINIFYCLLRFVPPHIPSLSHFHCSHWSWLFKLFLLWAVKCHRTILFAIWCNWHVSVNLFLLGFNRTEFTKNRENISVLGIVK